MPIGEGGRDNNQTNLRQWIARNLGLGGLIRNSTAAMGAGLRLAAQGSAVGVATLARDKESGRDVAENIRRAGTAADVVVTQSGRALGWAADTAVHMAGAAGGFVAGTATRMAGGSGQQVEVARTLGRVVGSAGVGLVAGIGLTDGLVGLAAASGTHGAAATTSGLAALGGGSIASGGGGMAAGQAVTSTLVAGTAGSAVVSSQIGDR